MLDLPPTVSAGEVISSAWANKLREAVAVLAHIRGGEGISLTFGASGLIISAAGQAGDWRQGVIVGVLEGGTPVSGPDAVGVDLRYDVQIPGLADAERGLEVTLWRPLKGPAVRYVPAAVGDPCFVLLRPDDAGGHETFLCCPTESLAAGNCDQEPIP